MKKFDVIIIASILVVAGVFFGITKYKELYTKKNSNELYAYIYSQNKLYKAVNIGDNHSESIEIKGDFGKNVVKIHDNGVEVVEAECDDHICEKAGFKNKVGDLIVCLPNQLFIEIKGTQEADVDGTSK
ncbi:NusG domain II-containing protein [Clostridium aciditolerans]|uniref:NusG domain II-containing protein n=1 Tax=Clostridium aciditolerans TaxID=339861 RepID=A0A934M8U9_9CLOT|nr:NusG domain II-containing protein [Clostridium aciditolerans]MBI6875206.1 NusG domain II-containing protein [Clostridium aciditolerans]